MVHSTHGYQESGAEGGAEGVAGAGQDVNAQVTDAQGKGKNVDWDNVAMPTPPSQATLTERIFTSAASLSNISSSGPANLDSWIHGSLMAAEKGQSSSVQAANKTPRPSQTSNVVTRLPLTASLRRGSPAAASQAAAVAQHHKQDNFESFISQPLDAACVHDEHEQSLALATTCGQKQEMRDGDEVRAILAAPEPAAEDAGHERTDNTISSVEAEQLHDALFSHDGNKRTCRWDHILNFWPSSADGVVAREAWLGEWRDVLVHYTDHVWGPLSPFAHAARDELRREELNPSHNQSRSELRALGRLSMLLRHIRQGQST